MPTQCVFNTFDCATFVENVKFQDGIAGLWRQGNELPTLQKNFSLSFI